MTEDVRHYFLIIMLYAHDSLLCSGFDIDVAGRQKMGHSIRSQVEEKGLLSSSPTLLADPGSRNARPWLD